MLLLSLCKALLCSCLYPNVLLLEPLQTPCYYYYSSASAVTISKSAHLVVAACFWCAICVNGARKDQVEFVPNLQDTTPGSMQADGEVPANHAQHCLSLHTYGPPPILERTVGPNGDMTPKHKAQS